MCVASSPGDIREMKIENMQRSSKRIPHRPAIRPAADTRRYARVSSTCKRTDLGQTSYNLQEDSDSLASRRHTLCANRPWRRKGTGREMGPGNGVREMGSGNGVSVQNLTTELEDRETQS